jgi:hypothetical protein
MDHGLEQAFAGYVNWSGPGSTVEYTENLRAHLPKIFEQFAINSVLDAPCGDMVWMRLVLQQFPSLIYTGADIVKPLVDRHKSNYANDLRIKFLHLDITEDPLPSADLWIVRDVLFHLSHQKSLSALKNFCNSNIPYMLTTTHGPATKDYAGNTWTLNKDMWNGHFELLNLFAAPFDFPEPLYRFDDTHGAHPEREMCVWSRQQIQQVLALK